MLHPVEIFRILYLFTKSDIKTTVIPITFFAVAAAPMKDIYRLPHVVFWVWLHVLQFDISNQTLHPEEDMFNKSDRPLPSKRITYTNAIILRWLLIPTCFLLSAFYSLETLYSSIALVLLTILYNELSAHAGHWLIRNVVNACGFASFESGATLVAGILNVGINQCGIFATTIQAQDFKDIDGDRRIGRRTIPITFSTYGRYSIILPMILWSTGLSSLWKLDTVTSCIFILLGAFVGMRYILYKSRHEDQYHSTGIMSVWLTMAHSLPGYYQAVHLLTKA
ncbi:UbiA prenyltransferase family [Cyathus striatus]|nr:UbiA prenyltransferase family [Cyathus striatus]